MLIQQEHRHPSGQQQLIDLPRTRACLGRRVPVGRCLADPVSLVAQQDVEFVGLELAELVEVAEHRLHPRRPPSGDLSKRLRECRRARGVQDRTPLPRELAEQRQRDDALPGARAAEDDHGLLLRALPRALHSTSDEAVGNLLLVQQAEHLALLHLLGRECEQLPTRTYGAAQQSVCGIGTGPLNAGLEVGQELPAPLAGEQPAVLVLEREQGGDALICGVVQVGDARQVHVLGDRAEEVSHVSAVAPDLLAGVQPCAAASGYDADVGRPLEQLGLAPLLELDNDVRVPACSRVEPAQDDVGALAREREAVLEQDLDLVEAGLDQVSRQDVEAALPRADLSRGRTLTYGAPVLLHEREHQAAIQDLHAKLRRGSAIDRQRRTPWLGRNDLPAGGGSSVVLTRSSGRSA